MKFKTIIKEHSATIAIILTIIVTAALSFADIISNEQAINYLFCADAGLAISILLSSIKDNKNINLIISKLKKQETSKKVTRREHYQMLDSAVLNADSQIWIMTIDSALSTNVISTIPEREIYYNNIETIAKTKRNVTIRRIYGLPIEDNARNDKISWILADAEKFKDCSNYHMRIFDWRKFASIPTPISLQIVDDTFVGLVNMQSATTGVIGNGEDICISDKNVVQHLKLYYEEIWNKSDEFKTGTSINYNYFS